MIKLSKADYNKIVAHAESELPNEACGLIAGTVDGENKEIKKSLSSFKHRPLKRAFFA